MIAAVVPAAGQSSRMGRPKLALPIGDRTVLECVVNALRAGGIERVLVVTGPHTPIPDAAGATTLRLPEPTADMRATVEAGLAWLEEHDPPDAWLLAPADYPALSGDVVRTICAEYESHPDKSIVVPSFEGRRGHPVLIAWRHVAGIRAMPEGCGIDAYLREHAAETLELPVESAGVLADVNTPEDYERMLNGEPGA